MFLIAVELMRSSLHRAVVALSARVVRHARKPGGAAHGDALYPPAGFAESPRMTIITDPLFYLLAIPAIVALGLAKGGFAGVGMVSTPLLALTMPPLQAAAILLPILLVPGRDLGLGLSPRLERLESQGAAARRGGRRRRRLAVRGLCAERLCRDRGRRDRLVLRRSTRWFAQACRREPQRPSVPHGRVLGLARGLHLDASSRSARRPTRFTSCRSGSTSSP